MAEVEAKFEHKNFNYWGKSFSVHGSWIYQLHIVKIFLARAPSYADFAVI